LIVFYRYTSQRKKQNENELANVQIEKYANVQVRGLMGMASFSDDLDLVRSEFRTLKLLFEKKFINHEATPAVTTHHSQPTIHNSPLILSMGMSGDYKIAIEEGSNMVRIGSLLFGERNYAK
jgi:PLP dependent protein